MKRKRFTEEQTIAVLKTGAKTADLARKHGISETTFYNWKTKFGGTDVSSSPQDSASVSSTSLTTSPRRAWERSLTPRSRAGGWRGS
ncbi:MULTISPECIES: transposase [unclassified Bradyrhizobium]|uniref:transposase n=1 Tax=unclassified Bradyrhizobium TaxID=2631580 RepID=UPI0028EB3CC2|nr:MULTISPECIES: transposase [unclassified Bradyrhizobium]